MRKIIFYIFILTIAGSVLMGCNMVRGTARGMKDGAKEDWEAVKRWDKNFREKWW